MLSFEDWFSTRHATIPVASARRPSSRSPRAAPRCRSSRATARSRPATSTRSRSRRVLDAKEHVGRRRAPQEVHLRGDRASRASSPPSSRRRSSRPTISSALEDLYLPYKQKRKTKADARARGGARAAGRVDVARLARGRRPTPALLDEGAPASSRRTRGVADGRAAIEGARDIVIERLSEDAEPARARAQRALRRGLRAHDARARRPSRTASSRATSPTTSR